LKCGIRAQRTETPHRPDTGEIAYTTAVYKARRRLTGKSNALVLLDALFANPYISAAGAQKILGVSNPPRQVMAVLVKAGMLKEITGRKWGQL